MPYKTITLEKSNNIATISLDDPATRNAITGPIMLEELIDLFSSLQRDKSISVCILTGIGKGFSSGGNIHDMASHNKMFAGEPLELQQNYRDGIHRLTKLIYSIEVPIIAAINGAAFGAGFDLTLLCDFRIASERATFCSSFINLGIIAGDGGIWLMRKILGIQRASELALTGRVVDAEEALSMGLVMKTVKHDTLMDEANTLASVIATKSRDTLIITKRLLKSTDSLSYEEHLNLCSANQAMLHHAPAHNEALEKFLNRKEVKKGK